MSGMTPTYTKAVNENARVAGFHNPRGAIIATFSVDVIAWRRKEGRKEGEELWRGRK